MIPRPPRSTRTAPRFPHTTLFLSHEGQPDPRRELGADRRCRQRCRELSARSGRTAALLAVAVEPAAGGADVGAGDLPRAVGRSEEHTSELQSLMRISYAVFCLKKKKRITHETNTVHQEIQQH